MKLEILDNYPDQIKDYVEDYNNAVDSKDITEVDMAINGILTFVFSNDENLRNYANIILSKIGIGQYKFLKNAVRVIMRRYQGEDPIKSNYASISLGQIVVGNPSSQLITDSTLLEKITAEERERLSRTEIDQQIKKQYIQKVKSTQLDLSSLRIIPEIYNIGQFYNKCLVDDNKDEAFKVIQNLIGKLFIWYSEDKNIFIFGCELLELMAKGSNSQRPLFFKDVAGYLMGFLNKGKDNEKTIIREILIQSYKPMQDLFPDDIVGWLISESEKRKEELLLKNEEELAKKRKIQKLIVTPKLKWAVDVQKLAKQYNDAIISTEKKNSQKILNQTLKLIEKYMNSSDKMLWLSVGEFLALLLEKNPEYVKDIVTNLIKSYQKPKNSEILSLMTDELIVQKLTKSQIIQVIIDEQEKRETDRKLIQKEKEEERKKIDSITIKVDGDWPKKFIKMVENINDLFLKNKQDSVKTIINSDIKEILQAKDNIFRSYSQEIFIRLAEKYPQLLDDIVGEYLELFNSTNPARFIAVEVFGRTYHAGLIKNILPNINDEVRRKIESEYDERRKEIENILMADKISHIKIDVQTIPIKDIWPKDIQKICRSYNDAILKQEMQLIIDHVTKIVNIFMTESGKKEERLNFSIEVLGLISKKNIELIAPTINLLLEMVDSDDLDKKFRAIRALGEVTKQRPGWAYMGINKLINTANATNESNDDARMRAMLELSKIGQKDPVMLVEYVPNIIEALSNDPNKHVRRLAAWTLGSMAEAIPLEAKEAIPALTEALHDEYVLVRKFADKALSLIRTAMRKI